MRSDQPGDVRTIRSDVDLLLEIVGFNRLLASLCSTGVWIWSNCLSACTEVPLS